MSLDTNLKNLTTALATKLKELRTWANGNDGTGVSRLSTTATTIVDAINEVNAAVAGSSGIDDGTTSSSSTWSSSKIDSEIDTAVATKPSINDSAASGSSVYSSTKTEAAIAAAVDGLAPPESIIDDDTASAGTVYSSSKTDEQIGAAIDAVVADAPTAFDTLKEIADYIAQDQTEVGSIMTALDNRVRVDTASQGLTSTQQGNARTNIAAASAADLSALSAAVGPTDTDYVALFEAGLV